MEALEKRDQKQMETEFQQEKFIALTFTVSNMKIKINETRELSAIVLIYMYLWT